MHLLTAVQTWNARSEILRRPDVARCSIHNCTGRWPDGPQRDFLCKLREAMQEFLKRHLFAYHSVVQHWKEDIPIRVTAIELPEFVLDVYVPGVRDESCVAEVRAGPCEPASELQSHGERFADIVKCGDFQLGQIEAFTQHVNADHNSGIAPQ